VGIACDLLAWLRLLALDHHQQLSRASPAILRRALLNVPARLVHRARRRLVRLDDTHPYQADLILAWNKSTPWPPRHSHSPARPDQSKGPTHRPTRGHQGRTRPPAGPLSCPNTETTTHQAIKLDATPTPQDRERSGLVVVIVEEGCVVKTV
jgi:hypothetical protein